MIVLDSSYLVALHNEGDVHHEAALEVRDRIVAGEWGVALLLEYVFLEVVTVLRMRLNLDVALGVGETLLRAREVEFVPSSAGFMKALETFRLERDADLSFADAAIVSAARRESPGYVATFDSDFSGLLGVTVVP